ncbi:MAG: fibronectin type III domain-containing protein [Candidatus Nanopelagicales bacterium]
MRRVRGDRADRRHRALALGVVMALLVAVVPALAGLGAAQAYPAPVMPGDQGWAVSLGDSYISGEGGRWAGDIDTWAPTSLVDRLGPTAYYDNPTDTAELIPGCHRSKSAEIHFGNLLSKNLACSGAELTSQIWKGEYKPGIDFVNLGNGVVGQAQMLQDFAAAHPSTSATPIRLVALSIGGNDFGFGDLVATCVEDFLESTIFKRFYCKDDFSTTDLNQRATTVATNVPIAIANIRTAMSNAGYLPSQWTLVVQNYPSPLPEGGTGDHQFRYGQSGYTRFTTGGCPFWDVDATWANQEVLTRVNGAVATGIQTARDSGVSNMLTLDLSGALYGNRLCERNDATNVQQVQNLPKPSSAPYPTNDVLFSRAEYVQAVYTGVNPLRPFMKQESMHPSYLAQMGLRSCLRQVWENDSSGRCVPGARTGLPVSGAEPPMLLLDTRPRPVTSVRTTARDRSVRVAWTPDPEGAAASSYGMSVCPQPGGDCVTQDVAAPSTQTVVSGLTNGTTYAVTVAATNQDGTSKPTSGPDVTPRIDPPGTPRQVSAAGGVTDLRVSWLRPTDGGPVTTYTVALYASSGATTPIRTPTVVPETTTEYDVVEGSLTAGTEYWVEVTAVNATGSAVAPRVQASTLPVGARAPRYVSAAPRDQAATVSWVQPSSDTDLIRFDVVRSGGAGPDVTTPVAPQAGSEYEYELSYGPPDDPLFNGTEYTITVHAVYSSDPPDVWAETTVTPRVDPPGTPDLVAAHPGDGALSVSWRKPDDGGAVASYRVDVFEPPAAATVLRSEAVTVSDPAQADYLIGVPGLANGTAYGIEVTAVNATDEQSAPRVTGTPDVDAPADPVDVVVVSGNQQAWVGWDAAPTGGAVREFRVVGYDEAVGTMTEFASVPGPLQRARSPRVGGAYGVTVTGLANGHVYDVVVVAENDAGAAVSEWHEMTPREPAPGPVPVPTPTASPSPTETPTPPPPGPSVTVVSPTDGSAISSGAWFGVSARTGGVPPGATAYVTIDGIAVAATTVTAEGSARFEKVPARTGGYAVRIGPAPATVVSAGWAMDVRPFAITGHRDLGSTVRFTVATGNFSPGTAVRLTRDGRTTAIGRVPTSGSSLGITVPDARGTYQVKVDSRQGWVYGLPAGVTRLP